MVQVEPQTRTHTSSEHVLHAEISFGRALIVFDEILSSRMHERFDLLV